MSDRSAVAVVPSLPTDFRADGADVAPLLVGLVPFAVVTGVAMVSAGLPVAPAVAMSVLVPVAAAVVARRTENLLATIAVGTVVLVVVQAV